MAKTWRSVNIVSICLSIYLSIYLTLSDNDYLGRRRAASQVLSLQSHMVHTPLIESKNEGKIDIVDGPLGSPPFSSDSVSSGIDSPVLSGDLTTVTISVTPIRRKN